MFGFFSQEIHLNGQLPDLGVKFAALALEILRLILAPAGTEDAGGALGHDFLPGGDLHRMDVEILGYLLDGLDPLDRFKRHAGLEFRVVSFSFCFHFVCVWFGLQSAPNHHNHNLAPGPIFGARLTILRKVVHPIREFWSNPR